MMILTQVEHTGLQSCIRKLAEHSIHPQSEELQIFGLGITMVTGCQTPFFIAEREDVHE